MYNKALANYFNPSSSSDEPKEKPVKELKIFKNIRQWATDRGLYVSGDPITQYVKLQEEAGELSSSFA